MLAQRRSRLFVVCLTLLALLAMTLSVAWAQGGPRLGRSGAAQGAFGQQPRVPAGSTTITHSSSQDIVPLNSVSCNNGVGHTDNSYYRVFDLDADFGITGDFDVTTVEFGVEEASAGSGGSQPISVILYTLDGPLALANLTEIGRTDTTIANQSLTIASYAVNGTVPAGETLVVEIFTPDGQTEGNLFFIGSNPEPETDPSYLRADLCGITQPTDTADIGFPDMNIVMNVTGDEDSGGGGGAAITLDKTVGTNPAVCASGDSIVVDQGTDVTYCYTVTNTGDITLTQHDLEDSELGTILDGFPFTLVPGASAFLTASETIDVTTVNTATWTAYNPVEYELITGSCEFPDISGTGTPLGLGDDDIADVTMPFQFPFFDIVTDQATVSNNGAIVFDNPGFFVSFVNEPLPTPNLPYGVAAFWDDLDSETGEVYVGEYTFTNPTGLAAGPNGALRGGATYWVVQWDDRPHFPGDTEPGTATFAHLFIAPGQGVDGYNFSCYLDTNFDNPEFDFGASATIGINQDESNAIQYSFDTPQPDLTGGSGVAYLPLGGGESASASDSATVTVLAPEIEVDPTELTEEHSPAPQVTEQTLTISNSGDADLLWTVEEAPEDLPASRPVQPVGDPALSSAGRAPLRAKVDPRSAMADLNELLGGAFPAFGAEFFTLQWVNFTTDDPGTLNPVGPATGENFGGDFVNGDFSTQYSLDFGSNQLEAVDTATGNETVIGPAVPVGGETWSGAAGDPTDGTLYGAATSCGISSSIYTINLDTGEATQIGEVPDAPCLIGIAINATGEMYGLDIVNDALLQIDPATGDSSVIGSVGFDANFAQGMDFEEETNTLYLAAFNNFTFNAELRIADLDTGDTTLVGTIGTPGGTEIDSFSIATGGGSCSTPEDVPWLAVDPTAGTTNPGGSDDVTVEFDSTGLGVGVYTANLCVRSNDLDEGLIVVPVTLTVGVPTAIQTGTLVASAQGVPLAALLVGGLLLAVAGGVLLKRRAR